VGEEGGPFSQRWERREARSHKGGREAQALNGRREAQALNGREEAQALNGREEAQSSLFRTGGGPVLTLQEGRRPGSLRTGGGQALYGSTEL